MPETRDDILGLIDSMHHLAGIAMSIETRLGAIELELAQIRKQMANDAIQQAAAAVAAQLNSLETDAQTAYAYLQTQVTAPDDVAAVNALAAQVAQIDSALKAAVPAAFAPESAQSGAANTETSAAPAPATA